MAIDRLETKRLVERRPSGDDRRTRMVHLPAAGKKLIRGAFAAHAKALGKVAGALSPRERRDVSGVLKRLGKAAQQFTAAR